MCGRYTLRTPSRQLALPFGVDEVPEFGPRYNIAPSQSIISLRDADGDREAVLLRWGLIPWWATDPAIGYKLINARAETVASKPAFRLRRCLVVADGFFEWQRSGQAKQPWFFRLRDEEPFAFAGLWESWTAPDGATIESACLVTTEANALVASIHERMPVILDPQRADVWLNPAAQMPQLQSLLVPYSVDEMEGFPVSSRVNSPKNDEPELIRRIEL